MLTCLHIRESRHRRKVHKPSLHAGRRHGTQCPVTPRTTFQAHTFTYTYMRTSIHMQEFMNLGQTETDEEKNALLNRARARVVIGKYQMLPPEAVDDALVEGAFRRLRHVKYQVCPIFYVCMYVCMYVMFLQRSLKKFMPFESVPNECHLTKVGVRARFHYACTCMSMRVHVSVCIIYVSAQYVMQLEATHMCMNYQCMQFFEQVHDNTSMCQMTRTYVSVLAETSEACHHAGRALSSNKTWSNTCDLGSPNASGASRNAWVWLLCARLCAGISCVCAGAIGCCRHGLETSTGWLTRTASSSCPRRTRSASPPRYGRFCVCLCA
jgi:hypothetical protein